MTRFIEEKLGLKVNAEKSKVDKPKGIKYLGFGFYYDTSAKGYKARPHPKAVAKFKAQMKKKAYWSDSFFQLPHYNTESSTHTTSAGRLWK